MYTYDLPLHTYKLHTYDSILAHRLVVSVVAKSQLLDDCSRSAEALLQRLPMELLELQRRVCTASS